MKTFKEYLLENEDNPFNSIQGKVFGFKLYPAAFGKGETHFKAFNSWEDGKISNPAEYVKQDIHINHNGKSFSFMISGTPKVIIKITDAQKLWDNRSDENYFCAPVYDIVDIDILDPKFVGHWLKTSRDNTPDWDILDKDEHADGDDDKANMLRIYLQSEGIEYITNNILKGFEMIKNGWLNAITPHNEETDEIVDMAYPIVKKINENIMFRILPELKNVRVHHTGDLPNDENI